MNEWLEERKKGIGGSDAAAIIGLSRYKSALQVYLEKIGELGPQDDNSAMYWGRKLEAIVAEEYSTRTGNRIQTCDPVVSTRADWFRCNPDRIILAKGERRLGVLECKTASEYVKSEWDDHVPEEYLIQLMHNVGVCGAGWGALAVLIGGQDFRVFEFERDEELIEIIFRKEKDFWENHVLARVPPAPTGASLDVLAKMYPKDNGKLIPIDNEIGRYIKSWLECRDTIKELEAQKDESAAQIQAVMGEAQKGIYQDDDGSIYGVSWTHVQGRMSFDVKAFEKDHPDLYRQYARPGNGYRRFGITRKTGRLNAEERDLIGGSI